MRYFSKMGFPSKMPFSKAQGQEKAKCPLHQLSGYVWVLFPAGRPHTPHVTTPFVTCSRKQASWTPVLHLTTWAFACVGDSFVGSRSLPPLLISRFTSFSKSRLVVYLCSGPPPGGAGLALWAPLMGSYSVLALRLQLTHPEISETIRQHLHIPQVLGLL